MNGTNPSGFDRPYEVRDETLSKLPRWYSGWMHFGLINVVGLGAIAECLSWLEAPRLWEWLLVPVYFAFANMVEWWVHRGPMHHRTAGLAVLFERHTGLHHRAYTQPTMGLRHARELYTVLFPPWFVGLLLFVNLPVPLAVGVLVSTNLGLLFYACGVAYYLTYEWFHLMHHLPADWAVSRLGFVRRLRAHHQAHHDPARMTKGNFNVSFPFFDWVARSTLPPEAPKGP